MRLLLIALMSLLLTATEARAGDPIPDIGVALDLAGGSVNRPPTRFEAVTDRDGVAVFNTGRAGRATLFVTPGFEGEAILRIDGRDISVPIRGQGRGADRVRAASFEVRRGERVRVRIERPDREG